MGEILCTSIMEHFLVVTNLRIFLILRYTDIKEAISLNNQREKPLAPLWRDWMFVCFEFRYSISVHRFQVSGSRLRAKATTAT